MRFNELIVTREDFVYFATISLLFFSLLGLPIVHYAIYLMPLIAFVAWISSRNIRFYVNRQIAPFLFLFSLAVFTFYNADYFWAKKAYLIFSYLIVFLLFDMSKTNFNVKYFNFVFISIFVLFLTITFLKDIGRISHDISNLSFIGSHSVFESTMAFPLGLFAVYFLAKKRYLLFTINLILAVFAFKRIAILAILIVIVVMFLPKKVKQILLNPILVVSSIVTSMVVIITLASGQYDEIVNNTLGVSTNQLLMGRQELWAHALAAVNFNYLDFIFYGVGHGNVVAQFGQMWRIEDILIHSDLLSILLEHGFLGLVIFSYLLLAQKTYTERYLALYLAILFLTDNVLIYQHVMIPYLMLLAAERRVQDSTDIDSQESR